MVELVVFTCPWIGKPEKVVLVAADRGFEPAGFKYCLCQYYFRIFYAILLYTGIKSDGRTKSFMLLVFARRSQNFTRNIFYKLFHDSSLGGEKLAFENASCKLVMLQETQTI